ncbi:MAG TPA: NUDIX hydrolase [Woeseiaceae bacterium]|nr:NUDIX hydrolase [Woeseiaceae bacterium]
MTSTRRSPVRPQDAASLLVYRRRGRGLEVLMGRRRREARFTPGVYVFPGGRLEPDDRRARPATEFLSAESGAFRSPAHARALAMAAVRETAEETGLVLGTPGDVGPGAGGWDIFRALGVAPPLHRLRYVGRAITPACSPWRYHARFFMVDARHLHGSLGGDGELLDLRWVDPDGSVAAGLIDVTEAMLAEIRPCLADPRRPPLLLSYRGERCYLRRERPGS